MICICLFSYLTINYLIKYDIAVAKQIKCIGISFFSGASVPLHHFYCVHHAAVPIGVRCGAECHFFTFPHHRPLTATHY